jgi:segregation and condensation protein B
MSDNYIKNVVEAALLAAGRPLQLTELAQLFEESARPEPTVLRAALDALEADYASRGIEVKETATGFRIQVRRDLANEVSRLWPERPPRYSRALLETLALIAYRQPITRAEIEAVRGVAVNPNIIKTVIERNWVRVVGTRDVPGRPELLGTTREFLDYFGLRSLDELPPLAELKAMGEINLQLDLAKPTEPGSDDGSSGAGGANSAGEGGASAPPSESTAAAASAGGAEPAAVVAADADEEAAAAVAASMGEEEPAAAASKPPLRSSDDVELVAYEHDPHAATITHVDIESDSTDVTVEVEALTDPSPTVLEADFEPEDLGSTQAEEDEAADDEEELSAGPQSSTELVAAPRDRDD